MYNDFGSHLLENGSQTMIISQITQMTSDIVDGIIRVSNANRNGRKSHQIQRSAREYSLPDRQNLQ